MIRVKGREMKGLLAIGLAALVASGFGLSRLQASNIYWTDAGTHRIQRADLNGTNVENLVSSGLAVPMGIALEGDSNKLYWTDRGNGTVQCADFDGTNVKVLVTGIREPGMIALDTREHKMYWTSNGIDNDSGDPSTFDRIQRANLDGTGVEDLITITRPFGDPFGIALDTTRGKVYWTDFGFDRIYRSNLDGTEVEDLVANQGSPLGLAIDAERGKMYWADYLYDKVQRANLDGSNVEDIIQLSPGPGGPRGIALDLIESKVYWTDDKPGGAMIGRATLDGTGLENLVTAGLQGPNGIAFLVPEPATLALLALGGAALVARRKRN